MSTKTTAVHPHRLSHRHRHYVYKSVKKAQLVLRVTAMCLMVIALLAVVVQLLYPYDRALPYARVGGLDVGGKDRNAIVAQLQDYAQYGETTIKTPSREWRAKWQSIGVTVDQEASAAIVVDYAWWERLLPFSSVIRIAQAQDLPMIGLVDDTRVEAFATKLVAEDKQAAREAVVTIQAGQIKVDDAKNGYKYTVESVKRQVQAVPMTSQATVELVPQTVRYLHSASEIDKVTKEAEQVLAQTLTLKVAGKTYLPGRGTIGEWLNIAEDATSKQLALVFKKDAVAQYIEQINKEVAVVPGTSTVTLLDGQEIGRTPAAAGQSIVMDSALANIEKQLRTTAKTAGTVDLQLVTAPAKINYVRTYSQASSGLQALIQDWERDNSGTFGIVVREVGGQNRYADFQPDKPFVTASTFKMFLAYTVLTKIERGEITFGQINDMGWTVDSCMKEMILHSTNPCAISFLNLVGWGTAEQMVQDAGFSATTLNNQGGGQKYSTIRDETNFLLRLQAGTLMGEGSTAYLLDLMKRQVWRGGIPSGVPRGVTVADKVGFYNGYRHDVAIVYGPKGTYIVGVMSYGGADWQFSNLSRKVYDFFSR